MPDTSSRSPHLPAAWPSLLVVGLLVPLPALALQPLTVFLDGVRARSTEYRGVMLATSALREEERAAHWRLGPALTVSGTYTRNQYRAAVGADPAAGGEVVIQPYDSWTGAAQVSVPVIDVPAWQRARAASHDAASSAALTSSVLAEVQRQTALAYFRLLSAEAQRRAFEKTRDSALQNLALTRAKRGEGAATELDVARASVEVESANRSIVDQELDAALARRSLITLSGIMPEENVLEPQASLDEESPLTTWEELAATRSPALQAAVETSTAAAARATAASASILPVLSVSLVEQASNTSGYVGHKVSYSALATLSWRLDGAQLAEARGQGLTAERLHVAEERTRDSLLDAVHEAWQRVHTGIAQCRAARSQASAAELAAKVAGDRYAAGAGTQLDLIQAERDAAAAESARIRADADLQYARAALRLTAGVSAEGSLP